VTGLSHINAAGDAHMVDVSAKPETARQATARAHITMQPATLALITNNTAPKGDVLAAARLAGILAAKQTCALIPLCHPLPITAATIDLTATATGIAIAATVRTTGRTGVEMEALTAATIAALTIYDMVKAVDRAMTIGDIRLTHKSGGKSGEFSQE